LHLLTMKTLHADSFDLMIDLDGMSNDPVAAAAAEKAIADLTGAAISFADCKIEPYDDYLKWAAPSFAALEAQVASLLDETAVRESCRVFA
jgi:hypothetical protein